ncbi:Mannose-1-phosphate guanyltransferase [Sphaceloma murrayae]|uniref:Mannose-1-phosphate guanyltransferase n=1 Tax=Sphaceloma murrayae TaxID=2082308 RepID=A0A2K1QXB5_9PEZI|nr:Mannose-1-phosphate guanyltransferase [Sphaceloma murrayae]
MAPHSDLDMGLPLRNNSLGSASTLASPMLTPPAGYDYSFPSDSLHRPSIRRTASTASTSRTRLTEGLNIIIPMGGIGSRFQREGYRFPKPLIKIVGRPMLCWLVERLKTTSQDTIWLAVNEDVEQEFQIGQLMKKWFPNLDSRVLKLPYLTHGAAETLFIVTQAMPASHRRRRTVSLDCDTIYHADILTKIRELPAGHGACCYFEDHGSQPIFSYIQLDHDNTIVDIQEKKAISTHANTGAYVFPSAAALSQWANVVLDSKLQPGDKQAGEYFTSQLIELMIRHGEAVFQGINVDMDGFSCVGTPKQLEDFLKRIHHNDPSIQPKKQRFCFDLDGTLVGSPDTPGDYSTCPPIQANIELVQALHKAGHYIIIQTARRMRTHNGNVGAVIADIGATTITSLLKYKIPYDEIFFGKPWAHIYVDDLAVNANLDTRKELGWLAAGLSDETENALADLKHAKQAGILPSRDFNTIQIIGDKVQKSSRSSKLLAEMYFYCFRPTAIADLFPTIYSANYFKESGTYSFTMEKLHGISYSHLLTARSLTAGRLRIMLQALHRVHNAPVSTTSVVTVSDEVEKFFSQKSVSNPSEINIHENYAPKLRQRYKEHRAVYDRIGARETARIYDVLVARLDAYEHDGSAIYSDTIHGDPVFSNILLNETERKVSFLDVRCQQGDKLTAAGDIAYDLAKVFQSLQGYDYVILADDEKLEAARSSGKGIGMLVTPEDRRNLELLQNVFWAFLDEAYGNAICHQDLINITASLLFSLIPLHRPLVQPLFLQMCVNLLEYETACPL